jgi:hypothetical protein
LDVKKPDRTGLSNTMRYAPGANLHTELDCVRVEYETLLNTDVEISDNDYCTLIINFLPSHLASFVAQISANTKAIAMVQHANAAAASTAPLPPIDPKLLEMSAEAMMLLALKEYDRKADSKPTKPKDAGVAASMISSEKPGSKTGGGKGGKGKGPRKPIGVCWNCGGKGHKQDECLSPKPDKKSKDQKTPNAKGNSPGSKPKPAAGPSNTANAAASATLDEVAGAWSVFDLENIVAHLESSGVDPVYDGALWALDPPLTWNTELVSDHGDAIDFPDLDTPDLLSVQGSDDQTTSEHHFVEIKVGQC